MEVAAFTPLRANGKPHCGRKQSLKNVRADTNGTKRSKVRGALRSLWRFYRAICTFFATLVVLSLLYGPVHDRYRYVELPNGTRLAVTEWFESDGGVVLKNSHGDIVVPPDIGGVVWNDQFVAGWRATPGNDEIYFIYKVGSLNAIEFRGDTAEEYRRLKKESGLKSIVENGYHHYSLAEQNFLDLIQIPEYSRAWYE